ncbi:unnamed protein product [Prunus armeniaca]
MGFVRRVRCKNPEGGLELVTSDATVVEMVGHIPSNKVIVLYYSEIEDYEYDADSENCDRDLTHNYQVKEVDYIEVEDEETFENVRTKVANEDVVKEVPKEDAGVELPNEDIGVRVTIDNEGEELPNEDENADSEIKGSDYDFSENEAEVRPTVGEIVADEGTSHGAPGEVSSDGADTSEFDSGSETEDEVYGSKINREEGTFAVKTLSLEHQCGRVDNLRHTTSKWLCDRYANKLKRNSDFDLKSFQEDVLEDYKINVTKIQVYRAKRLARDLNEGTFKEQYARLWDYAEELKIANDKLRQQEITFDAIHAC